MLERDSYSQDEVSQELEYVASPIAVYTQKGGIARVVMAESVVCLKTTPVLSHPFGFFRTHISGTTYCP